MSEIKLVRCPKCDRVLPEPPVFTVYQCGGCGAVLQAKKKKKKNSDLGLDKGVIGEGVVEGSGESRVVEGEGGVVQEGDFGMGSKSPMRSTFGDGSGIKSSMEDNDLNEFHGGFPKSPMRDRFLNDLSSGNVSPSPMRSRDVSPSPMRGRGSSEFDFDGVGQSPARAREVSMSPLRGERGNRSPMSVRTRNFSRSPMREVDGANSRSPARSMNGNMAKSPLRGDDVSGFDDSVENDQEGNLGDCDESEKEDRRDKMTPKTSFNFWLSDENAARESNDNGLGRGRKKWRDVIGDDVDRISEGKESVHADDQGMTSEGSFDDQTHGEVRSSGHYIRGCRRAKANADSRFTGNYGHSRRNAETSRGPSTARYTEHVQHTHNYRVAGDYSEEEHLRFKQGYVQHFSPDKTMPRSSYYDHGPGLGHGMEDAYDHFPLYEDPYAQPMGSEHFPNQPQFLRHAMPGYYPGQSWDFDRNSVKSYNNGIRRHYPADGQSYDSPSSFGSWRSSNILAHQSSSHSLNLQTPGPRTYDPRMSHTAPRERPSRLAPHRGRNVLVASQNKRLCLPIAGGSPFLICHKCSELLKLPGKFMKKQKNEYKLQCGACSSIISFDHQKKSFGVPSSQKKPDTDSAVSGSSEVLNVSKSRPRHHRGSFAATSTTLGSYDFDAGRHSFQSVGSEASEISRGQRMVSNNDKNIQDFSPSSRASKDEFVSDNSSTRNNSSETPLKIRPPPGSPLREHLDYSGQYHKVEPENARFDYEKEKQELEKDTFQESSVVNTTVASETEVHSYGLSNSLSDSREDDYDDKQSTKSPSRKSPFASKSVPAPEKDEVFVNGQQVPHHVVKKAEKLAGPIEPGDYWYDPKAGFWGVTGHPGLGILPPSIPEFSFPMSESCSRGDTAVYVNGRELEKSDLDLLAKRGLPTMRDRRYIIDISGKALEEQSKDFIVNLGKLAPTIERVKRGFGMRVPEHLKD